MKKIAITSIILIILFFQMDSYSVAKLTFREGNILKEEGFNIGTIKESYDKIVDDLLEENIGVYSIEDNNGEELILLKGMGRNKKRILVLDKEYQLRYGMLDNAILPMKYLDLQKYN